MGSDDGERGSGRPFRFFSSLARTSLVDVVFFPIPVVAGPFLLDSVHGNGAIHSAMNYFLSRMIILHSV